MFNGHAETDLKEAIIIFYIINYGKIVHLKIGFSPINLVIIVDINI